MKENIDNILLLNSDILSYSREFKRNDRESIKTFLEI